MINVFNFNDTPREHRVYYPDSIFDRNFENEWLSDPLVKEMVKDVDKTVLIQDRLLLSPIFGYIAPSALSTGVKGLILILKCDFLKNEYFLSDLFGENCYKWLFEISVKRDFNLIVSSDFLPPDNLDVTKKYQVNFVKDNYISSNLDEIWDKLFDL